MKSKTMLLSMLIKALMETFWQYIASVIIYGVGLYVVYIQVGWIVSAMFLLILIRLIKLEATNYIYWNAFRISSGKTTIKGDLFVDGDIQLKGVVTHDGTAHSKN